MFEERATAFEWGASYGGGDGGGGRAEESGYVGGASWGGPTWGFAGWFGGGSKSVVSGPLGVDDGFVDFLDGFEVGIEFLEELSAGGFG